MDYLIKPWEHQLRAIELSKEKKDLALFYEMGTGKTATGINLIRARCEERRRLMRVLILAPIIVLQNWKREFGVHSKIPQGSIRVLQGAGKKRVETLKTLIVDPVTFTEDRGGIVITNYEAVQMEAVFKLLLKWRPEILICDESHRLKNYKSKRAKAVAAIADGASHRYILTGTPILNSAQDIFMQFRVLDSGETFGRNFFAFRAKYFVDQNERWKEKQNYFPKFVPREQTYPEMNQLIYSKAIRADKADCLDLPPLIRKRIEVPMGKQQARMYKEMRKEFITFLNGSLSSEASEAVVAQLAIIKALRLQQIVSGYVKTDSGEEITLEENPRLQALSELIDDITPRHKVIVWAHFKENIRAIKELLKEKGIEWAEVHGDISDKQKEVDKFTNEETCRVMVANQAAGGIGINMIAASYSIFYTRSFSLEHDLQAEARNHRGGSEIHSKITRIDLVTPETIDALVLDALASKQNISNQILKWGDSL